MTEDKGTNPEGAITEKILADAQAQARKLVDNAGRSAEAESRKTEREIAKIEEDIRAGWDAKVEKLRMREVSTARVEARRIILNAREEAVKRVFAEIGQGLEHLRTDPGRYRESLRNLAAEALTAIGGGEAVLRICERDSAVAGEAFAQDLGTYLGRTGEGPRFRIEYEGRDNGGGCIASSPDGRIVFDNTFGRRLERLRSELRALIIEGLAESDE